MKRNILVSCFISFLFFTSQPLSAQAPNWQWAKGAGGPDNNEGAFSVAADSHGNSYITGYFWSNTSYFDTIFAICPGMADAYLASYNPAGHIRWAHMIGGPRGEGAWSVVVDVAGNPYLAGSFMSQSLNIGPFVLSSNISDDGEIFLSKFDSNGNAIWAKRLIGEWFQDEPRASVIDQNGKYIVTGTFRSPYLILDSITIYNAGYNDVFLAKLDSAGSLLWAKSAGGTDYEETRGVDIDASNNIYVAGSFVSPLFYFDTVLLKDSTFYADLFLAKYNAGGQLIWAKAAGGKGIDLAWDIATDAWGNSYITGFFESPSIKFDSITLNNTDTSGTRDIFLVKYDANGNALWARHAGGVLNDRGTSVHLDAAGNVWIAGDFRSTTVNFDSITLTNADTISWPDIFLAKYSASGHLQWAGKEGEHFFEYAYDLEITDHNDMFLSGEFSSNPFTLGSCSINQIGAEDIFIAKANCGMVTATDTRVISNEFTVSPNPFNDQITICAAQNAVMKITNLAGQTVKTFIQNKGTSTTNLSELAKGFYLLTAETSGRISVLKLIKQ